MASSGVDGSRDERGLSGNWYPKVFEEDQTADGDVAVVLDRRLESLEKARKRAEDHGQTIPASSAFVLELRWCP